jgi:cytochrome c oxidase subunit III
MKENTMVMPEGSKPFAINSKKFILWLFMVTIVMVFAALTSAYIVRKADGEWLLFTLPSVFTVSTVIILLSSVSMQFAYTMLKKGQEMMSKLLLAITLVLGVVFLYTQLQGWSALVDANVFFGGASSNPAGSFAYVLSGLHAFHLGTGLIYMVIVLSMLLGGKISAKNSLQFELCTTYWHFLDLLWIYLFVFLMVNN